MTPLSTARRLSERCGAGTSLEGRGPAERGQAPNAKSLVPGERYARCIACRPEPACPNTDGWWAVSEASGLAIPQFVIDAPGGGGKIPLLPQYVLGRNGNQIILRNYKYDIYTYPDVVATCDEPRFEDDHVDTLVNPKVIVEVLSPSTELWDRGKKFKHYRNIPSLRECVLISQDHVMVEKFSINADGEWALRDYRTLEDILVLDSISCQIKLSDIYARIEFSERDESEESCP